MDDYDYNEANTDNYDYNEDNTISFDDSASAIVRSDISESIVTNPTSLQKYISPVWKHYSLMTNEQKAISCRRYQASNGDSSNLPNLSDSQMQLDFSTFITRPSKTMSADTVKRDVMKAYDKRKAFIKKELQNVNSKISLTCDIWTLVQQLGYLAVMVHFINKTRNLVFVLLLFKLILFPHFGVNIANCIKVKTDEHLITNKLQTITLDNAGLNNVAIHELVDYISQDSLININEELFHNRCFAHILNLIVKDAIHSTPKRHQAYLDICEYKSENLIIPSLDCDTRWNSTFTMLQLAIKMKNMIIRMGDRDRTFSDLPEENE
ncbi:13958_t:CDS:2 [Dentiscutata erythropus]|uniref:13958_t:CDS:1 n=1 Tax=Dentiscutata erythropus TaxID=1348616 RepID=A0A9N9JYD3_9GLOM|nr:13958_t:CDS:2 [Dentiscutata erythropus]